MSKLLVFVVFTLGLASVSFASPNPDEVVCKLWIDINHPRYAGDIVVDGDASQRVSNFAIIESNLESALDAYELFLENSNCVQPTFDVGCEIEKEFPEEGHYITRIEGVKYDFRDKAEALAVIEKVKERGLCQDPGDNPKVSSGK